MALRGSVLHRHVENGDDGGGFLALVRCRDAHLHSSGNVVRFPGARRGLALGIGSSQERLFAVDERAACSLRRQCEHDGCSGDGLLACVFHANHQVPAHAVTDVINCPLSLDYNNGQRLSTRILAHNLRGHGKAAQPDNGAGDNLLEAGIHCFSLRKITLAKDKAVYLPKPFLPLFYSKLLIDSGGSSGGKTSQKGRNIPKPLLRMLSKAEAAGGAKVQIEMGK